MKNNLRLPLKKKWFDMTKEWVKTEDYREINEYWTKRLTQWKNGYQPISACVDELNKGYDYSLKIKELNGYLDMHNFPRQFDYNIVTLGYPKSTDTDRILKFEHKGIEIRTGNPEWGAEPNKLYFVIMHGKRL